MHSKQAAFGARLEYPNDIYNWSLGAQEIQANYDPALGFVSRSGIRRYDGSFRYRIRPRGTIRTIDTTLEGALVTDTSGEIGDG